MPEASARDPFGPLEGVVTLLLGVLFAVLGLAAVIAVVGLIRAGHTDVSFATIGDGQTCVSVSNETPTNAASEVRQVGINRNRASMRVEQLDLCLKHPTPWQEALSTLRPIGDLIFAAGGLLLVRRSIRAGRRHGVFTRELADSVRQLGLFMVAMTLIWPFVAAAGEGVIIHEAVPGRSLVWGLLSPHIQVALVVVSAGVLSIARILRRGVSLQEDADATI